MDEEWRATHVHPEYLVSNLGRVRSLDRRVWGGPFIGFWVRPGKIMTSSLGSHGYPAVKIRPAGTVLVHALVAIAFLGPYPEGQEVRHKDGNRENPKLDNLEYGTKSQNSQDAIRHGSFSPEKRKIMIERGMKTRDERYPGWRQRVFTPGQFT